MQKKTGASFERFMSRNNTGRPSKREQIHWASGLCIKIGS